MASVCEGSSRESFVEQVFSSLVTLTLHLNDPVETVCESSKTCFISVAPLLNEPKLVQLFNETLQPKDKLNYMEFISDFSKILVQKYQHKVNFFIMNCISYFKNPVGDLRANAATFAGHLIHNLTDKQINDLSKEHILNGEFEISSYFLTNRKFACVFSIYRLIKRHKSRSSLPCSRSHALHA